MNAMRLCAPFASFAVERTPAEKTVIFYNGAGSGPAMSMPSTGISSLIC
jgi:ferredoxin-NADP reductase